MCQKSVSEIQVLLMSQTCLPVFDLHLPRDQTLKAFHFYFCDVITAYRKQTHL